MSCLVVLELENGKPNRPSLATISAAKKLDKDIDVLILDDTAKEEVGLSRPHELFVAIVANPADAVIPTHI